LAAVGGGYIVGGTVTGALRRTYGFAAFECGLWVALYLSYLALRDVSIGSAQEAVRNGVALVHAEEALGLFHEASVQRLVEGSHLETLFDAYYLIGFGPTIVAMLLWLMFRHRSAYKTLRTWLLVSLALASVLYLLVPTAPPRLVPGLDIGDTVGLAAHDTGSFLGIRFNPYAAMPSMHVGWALLLGIIGVRIFRRPLVRVAFALYPLGMAICVIATGNHYFLDSIVGAGIALLAVMICSSRVRSRLRPSFSG
jgi:membrane-associated phospholipid phosphatase